MGDAAKDVCSCKCRVHISRCGFYDLLLVYTAMVGFKCIAPFGKDNVNRLRFV